MSRPDVLETFPRPSGKCDFILASGKEGRERVRVVLTLYNTMCCMTCLTADACVHADVAREHHEAQRAAEKTAALERERKGAKLVFTKTNSTTTA